MGKILKIDKISESQNEIKIAVLMLTYVIHAYWMVGDLSVHRERWACPGVNSRVAKID